nr:L-aspartate oxidase [Nitrospirota bacterium]
KAATAYAARGARAVVAMPSLRDWDAGPPAEVEDADKLRSSLRRVMWGKVGLVRTRDSLVGATGQLSRWERALNRPFTTRLALEVKNMVEVGRCIAEAALWRQNSVGAHYRADFPDHRGLGWKVHSHIRQDHLQVGSDRMPQRSLVVPLRARKAKPA